VQINESPAEGGTASQHLYAYSVREFDGADGKKARAWTRIGVAFPHKDGTGFNIEVHSFPLDGRLVLFPVDDSPREDERAEAAPQPSHNSGQQRRR
jgi:hypothetical protein